MNPILKLFGILSEYRIKVPRLLDARKELSMKKANIPYGSVGKRNKLLIKGVWGGGKTQLELSESV